jgi:hypothetical protein
MTWNTTNQRKEEGEEAEEFKKLSEENKSTQKMLSEIRTMLSQFIQDEKNRRREGRR